MHCIVHYFYLQLIYKIKKHSAMLYAHYHDLELFDTYYFLGSTLSKLFATEPLRADELTLSRYKIRVSSDE